MGKEQKTIRNDAHILRRIQKCDSKLKLENAQVKTTKQAHLKKETVNGKIGLKEMQSVTERRDGKHGRDLRGEVTLPSPSNPSSISQETF